MVDRNSRNFSFPAQMGILLGFIGAGLIFGGLISVGLWFTMTGRPVLALQSDMLNPRYYNAIMAMQAVSTLFLFFLPVYFFALICYRSPAKFIGFNTKFNYKQIFIVLGILLLTFPLGDAITQLTNIIPIPKTWEIKFKAMEAERAVQEAALININSFSKYIISLIIIGLLPGIFEEVCFRGGVQNILIRWFKGPWVAIILTSVVFSIIHLSYYGFFVRFALGVILGFVYYYSGSIWLSILFHFLFNGIQVTGLYLTSSSGKVPAKEAEQHLPLWVGIIALAFIIYLFQRLRKYSLEERQRFIFNDVEDPNDFHNWIAKESQN